MKSRISSIGLVLCLALACLTSAFAQSNLRYDTNFVAYNTKLCFESALGTGPDICLKRSAAGALSFERPDATAAQGVTFQFAGQGGADFSLGTYQGTTSVGITDTAFHALIAAASDIKIPANSIAAAGKHIHVHFEGVYTNAAASLLNAEVMLCQVSGCATGTVVAPAGCAVVTTNQANNLTNGQFYGDCDLISTSTLGASGTFMAKSLVGANLGAATSAVTSLFQDTATAVSAAVDETKDQFVNPAFKFTTSNAGNSAIVHLVTVHLAN